MIHSLFPLLALLAVQRVDLGDIHLHYVESGSGIPVVLVHGSLADQSYWQISEQVAPLADHYRVIAYSRRYNHPNDNVADADHSALVEAADLAALIDRLELGAVHLVGHSYGAYTALAYAMNHPERVRSLVLAEPPLLSWLDEIPGGEGIESGFMESVWAPMGAAFREQGDEAGLELTAQWFFQLPFSEIEPRWQELFRNNVREWRALATSAQAFPRLDPDGVAALRMPTLLLSAGQNAGGFNDLIDGHLKQLIPDAERVVIAESSHEMFLDFPETTAQLLLQFLGRHSLAKASGDLSQP